MKTKYFVLLFVLVAGVFVVAYESRREEQTITPATRVVKRVGASPAVTAKGKRRSVLPAQAAIIFSDPRTPAQIAKAACPAGRCAGAQIPKTLSLATSNPIQPASWTVPNWYIDTANSIGCASDSNSGTAATCTGGCSGAVCTGGIGPVLSANEIIVHRWGTSSPILPQTTTWNVLSAQPVNYEKIVLSPTLVSNGSGTPSNFVILGSLSAVGGAFTAGTVTPKSIGSPGQLLTIASMPGGTVAGQLIQNTTRGSSIAIVDSISGGTAVLTQPLTSASYTAITAAPVPAEINTWVTGDSLQIYQAPAFNLQVLTINGGDSNLAFTAPTGWVQWITIPDASGTAGTSIFTPTINGPALTFAGVIFDLSPEFDFKITEFGGNITGCWMPGGSVFYGAFVFGGASNVNLTFQTSLNGASIDGDFILHGLAEVEAADDRTSIGAAYIDSRFALIHGSVVVMIPGAAPSGHPDGVIWGPGGIDLEPPNSAWQIVPTATFTQSLAVATVKMLGGTTASALVNANTLSGTVQAFQSGVTINVSNLDLYTGLQDPSSGCRYTNEAN
jgi:hypothetical protein